MSTNNNQSIEKSADPGLVAVLVMLLQEYTAAPEGADECEKGRLSGALMALTAAGCWHTLDQFCRLTDFPASHRDQTGQQIRNRVLAMIED